MRKEERRKCYLEGGLRSAVELKRGKEEVCEHGCACLCACACMSVCACGRHAKGIESGQEAVRTAGISS